MTSNTTPGERRWASGRRGGMTVLGKVPKPINLPSQRLENHGLDPNVEIVPKGTHSWGSKSSAGSNAWSMSALSPSTNVSCSSPNQMAGRPSSSGGTRPSTAGCEVAHDSNVNAWSSNSRPSSASGYSASNKVPLTSLRPRSAETRPGSSQLSRFAEPSPESGAWGSGATSERIRLGNSGEDRFSLSSGDFPTLGSEKDKSIKNREPLDGIPSNADSKDTWRNDGPSYEDGPRPSTERCNEESHPYQNHNIAPHYESWRGAPPVNHAGPIWYRGPPGPPPYGAHGGFPLDPFPYYPPPVPAPSLANSHVAPPHGVGPHGHYAINGDMFRPHIPESYMRPGMPVRPGFYPALVPYEGYYDPSMGLCNPSHRDLSYTGMPTGHPLYNRPVNLNVHDPKLSHSRPGEVGAPNQADTCHPHDPCDNSKFLRKQSDHWSLNDEKRWGHNETYSSNHGKGILAKALIQDNARGDDCKKVEDINLKKNVPAEKAHSRSIENRVGLPGGVRNMEDTDLTSVGDNSLIQKIGGLNAKARSPGVILDGSGEQHDGMQFVNSKANRSPNDANLNIVCESHYPSEVLVPVSHDIDIAPIDRSPEITVPFATATSSKLAHGAQSRGNDGKVIFNGQEADGWRKSSESHTVVSPAGSGSNIKNQVVEHHAPLYPAKVSEPNVQKGEEDSDAQRAEMKEIEKQPALLLQIEEEERTRDQKAKALAKLEELNRHSGNQAAENPGCKLDSVPPQNAAPLQQEGSRNYMELRFGAIHCTSTILSSATNFGPKNEIGVGDASDSTLLSMQAHAETVKTTHQYSSLLQNQLPTVNVNVDNAGDQGITTPVHEASRQKRAGNKQRQNITREKNSILQNIPAARTDVVKDHTDSSGCEEVADVVITSGGGKELAESSVHHQKQNKSGKNKNKLEELPISVPNESNNTEGVSGTEERNISNLNIKSSSIQSTPAKGVIHTSENHSSLSHEDAHARHNNSWKPQHSCKPRSSQGNRSEKSHNNDAVVWAPVRPLSKVEVIDQTNQKSVDESSALSVTRDNAVNNSPKTKRAEMERYVPKPVAKELSQQRSVQRTPSPPVDLAAMDGTGRRVKASQGSDYLSKARASVDSKHVDGKHKQRTQGSRSQIGSAKSVSVQVSHDTSAVVTGKNIETPNGSGENVKSNETVVREPPSRSDNDLPVEGPRVIACDGWNSLDDSEFSSSAEFVRGKDNVHPGREERHSFKGHKGTNSNMNSDRKGSKACSNELPNTLIETSQTETTVPSKESRAVGDRAMSKWKPKAQGFVTHDQEGNRSCNHQYPIAEVSNKTMKRETGHNQWAARDPVASGGRYVGGGISSSGHHGNKTDKSVASVRGHAVSSNQGFDGEIASGPFNVAEGHNEHRPSSGYQKKANHSGRFNKGPEAREDWYSAGQENKQHYFSGNRERQRLNSHFEYQPVNSYNRSSRQPNEHGAQTENQPRGMKFQGRGHGHARGGRGSFYGRQRGTPDAGYEL